MRNTVLFSMQVIKTVGEDGVSFSVLSLGPCEPWSRAGVAKSNTFGASPGCQPLWPGASAGGSGPQLPVPQGRMGRLAAGCRGTHLLGDA